MNRNAQKVVLLAAAMLSIVALLAGCGKTADTKKAASQPAAKKEVTIKLGTLQTDDILPLWVAQSEGLAKKAGINLDIITFQSAQEQIAAMTAGEIDGMMTDMVVPMQLTAGGTPVKAITVMQGAPAGVVAAKNSGIKDVKGLAGVKAGASSATVIEYIYDKALTDAGVAEKDIKIEEIKKLPVRFEMLNAGKIKAAGLPWTFYTLAAAQGATPIVDQEMASKYTSTVLEMSDKFLSGADAATTVKALLSVWDQGVDKINANPDSYRNLLADKANLPAPLRKAYKARTYPKAALPEQTQVDDVAAWMVKKGYLKQAISYSDFVYSQN